MKIINFGSLNIDKVYKTERFVEPGQSVSAKSHAVFPGGKGLNQSVAAARAGADVIHAGIIGSDGLFLKTLLEEAGADVSFIKVTDSPTGHAVIENDSSGQNRIIVWGGANMLLTEDHINSVLEKADPGDIALLQNETNLTSYMIKKAHEKGLFTAFNPSPVPEDINSLPLGLVDIFLVNETEAAALSNAGRGTSSDGILSALCTKFQGAAVIMTLGSGGSLYSFKGKTFRQDIFSVPVKDTTAAGDTFCGFFLGALCKKKDIPAALKEASAAAAIAVSKDGAASSIPTSAEVSEFIKNYTI